jgi:hypothetical protein
MEPQSIAALGAIVALVGALVGVGWRVGVIVRQVEDRIRERYGAPVFARLDELRERLAKVEYQCQNDVTGRKGVQDIRDRLLMLEGEVSAGRRGRHPALGGE